MKVRTTQEVLDSRLVLLGWRVFYEHDGQRMYANGLGAPGAAWTPSKAAAFIFTDAPNSARKGNDDGLRWAKAHARHLQEELDSRAMPGPEAEDEDDLDLIKVRVVTVRKRIWRSKQRSTTQPRLF